MLPAMKRQTVITALLLLLFTVLLTAAYVYLPRECERSPQFYSKALGCS